MTTTTHTTAAQASAIVRQQLKQAGITSKQVSVRADTYSMGSSIRVRIKDAGVPLSKVREVAMAQERVDRDQWGEVLSGANRYVDVAYSWQAEETLRSRWLPVILAAVDSIPPHDLSTLQPVPGTPCLVGRATCGATVFLGGRCLGSFSVDVAAQVVGVETADRAQAA